MNGGRDVESFAELQCWALNQISLFQSTFDMKSLLLFRLFLKTFHDMTCLTKGSEQSKVLLPPAAAELQQQGCTCPWGLHSPASACAAWDMLSVSYTCSQGATWEVERGVEMCVQRLRSCWVHNCVLPLNLTNMGSLIHVCWRQLKLHYGFWWEQDLSFRVRYRCLWK